MAIEIYVGNTGQGKTYITALTALYLLERNKKWFEKGKTNIRRIVATNIALAEDIEADYEGYISHWSDLAQLVNLREADVLFDDMSAYLDSQRWADTPTSVKRWLRLHEHYGCDIYGNAQDFLTIDPSVRRLTGSVIHVSKVIGSARPAATKPQIKFIWGLIRARKVAQELMDKETIKYEYDGWPSWHFIRREICEVFDTNQDLQMGEYPVLHHIERHCELGADECARRHKKGLVIKHA